MAFLIPFKDLLAEFNATFNIQRGSESCSTGREGAGRADVNSVFEGVEECLEFC